MGEKQFVVSYVVSDKFSELIDRLEDVLNSGPEGYSLHSVDYESNNPLNYAIIIFKKM